MESASLKLGILYAANTLGACIGSSICSFLLIGSIGTNNTRYFAVLINILIGITGLYLSTKLPPNSVTQNENFKQNNYISDNAIDILLLILFSISGLTSFGYEVIWTRLFIPFLGTSIYSFTLILLTVLIGITIGSYIYRLIGNKIKDALIIFCILELCIGLLAVFNIKICGGLDDLYFYLTKNNLISSWLISKS
ncbi:MAG TPA: hypothetical protein PLJ38_05230, partial [bacterium]|nr:hypothetical protein [bacterium]